MNNLKKIREEHGLSQYELAEKSGIGRSLIAKYETGAAKMTYRAAIILANFFHCYPYEILGEDVMEIHGGFEKSLKSLVDSNAVSIIHQLQEGKLDKKEQLLYTICLDIIDMTEEDLTSVLLFLDNYKKNKGYPTKEHIEAINKYGVTDYYRKTYGPVKDYLDKIK